MSRLALVSVRYGAAVAGGAESLARQIARRLARRHDVTVLTTCALDHLTWENVLPEGRHLVDGVRVLRFPVRRPRDLERFAAVHAAVLSGQADADDEERFLLEQGPDAPGLLEHLGATRYDAVIFFSALYLPTVRGLPLVGSRSILVPTLHDEAAAHLRAHHGLYRQAGALIFLSAEEQALAERLFDVGDVPHAVAGIGVEPPADIPTGIAKDRFDLDRPYLLFAGRIDPEKGCPELLRFFAAWASRSGRADLVMVGPASMQLPRLARVRHLGLLEEPDRWALTSAALATAVPSRYESLSLVALESMAVGVPILVRAGSPVMEGHVGRSRGGIVYNNFATFAGAVDVLLDQPDLVKALGSAGRRYVLRRYTWERVEGVFEGVVARVCAAAETAMRFS